MMKAVMLSQDKSNTLLLLATCLLVLIPHASHLPAWIIVTSGLILLWRGWITLRGQRMPPRIVLVPLAAVSVLAMYWHYHTLLGREVGVAMLVLLLTLKLLEMHAKRDLFVVLFLAFFLLLSNFFYSQSIPMALLTIAATVGILTTQVSFHYTGEVPPLKQRLRLGGFILLLAAPLTIVMFLLFPRIQGPLWGMPADGYSVRTGLSDHMSPGDVSQLAQSSEIAFRVKFFGSYPLQSSLYWRGPVLGFYNGRSWHPVRLKHQNISLQAHSAPIRYEVTLEPNNQRWLFALEMPRSLPVINGKPAILGPNLELFAPSLVNERIRYDVASITQFDLQANESAASQAPWLTLPLGFNPRTHAFATQLRQRTKDDAQLVAEVLRFFRTENFRYTLSPPALGKNAMDEFLFDTRAGFCEHYSSAFVVLMREMGIPARVVTGYQGGEINPADGYLTVRQSDAHAWAEVWLPGRGWVRVDPTAAVSPTRVEQNLASALPEQDVMGGLITMDAGKGSLWEKWHAVRQRWEAANNAWNQWVLNYTPDKQRRFVESLGFEKGDWRTMTLLLVVAGCIVTAIVVIPLLWQRRKTDPVDALYQALCRRLAKLGPAYARSSHEGPRSYAERLSNLPLPPEKKQAIARFLACYESARYGTMSTDPSAALAQLKSLFAQCR